MSEIDNFENEWKKIKAKYKEDTAAFKPDVSPILHKWAIDAKELNSVLLQRKKCLAEIREVSDKVQTIRGALEPAYEAREKARADENDDGVAFYKALDGASNDETADLPALAGALVDFNQQFSQFFKLIKDYDGKIDKGIGDVSRLLATAAPKAKSSSDSLAAKEKKLTIEIKSVSDQTVAVLKGYANITKNKDLAKAVNDLLNDIYGVKKAQTG